MSEWQPIETAKRDASDLLLYVPPSGVLHGWYSSSKHCWINTYLGQLCHPTHWMPLPEPPGRQPAASIREPLLSVFPDVQGGALCIHGTRVPWEAVISFYDEGSSPDEIVREYPSLTEQQVRDVIAWKYPTPPKDEAR